MTTSSYRVTTAELCQDERIEERLLIEVVDYGIAEPLEGESDKDWVFDSTSVHWIKKALRIHDDLDLDWVAVAIIIELQKEKENLLQENRHYRRQLKRFIGPDPR